MAEDTNNLQESNEQLEGEEKAVENSPQEEVREEVKSEEPKKNPLIERTRNLADKAKLAEEEKSQVLAEKEALEKERDFYQDFSESVSLYPEARDYQEQIKEKVMSGYTVEDATITTLAKEGKLGGGEVERPVQTIGGSASTPPTASENRSISEMSREEKRQALVEAEERGDLGIQ